MVRKAIIRCINENPVMGGHDLCLDKTCQWRLGLETRNEKHENGSKCWKVKCDALPKKLSVRTLFIFGRLAFVDKDCINYTELDTIPLCRKPNYNIRKGEPVLQC